MKRILMGAAAAAAMLFVATGASAQDESMVKSTQAADTAYAAKGYYPTGWSHAGKLDNGSQEESSISLPSGSFQIIGVCDLKCKNFDLQLTNSSGGQVDSDTETDDFPIVSTIVSGSSTYKLTAMMKDCNGLCAYQLKAYIKR